MCKIIIKDIEEKYLLKKLSFNEKVIDLEKVLRKCSEKDYSFLDNGVLQFLSSEDISEHVKIIAILTEPNIKTETINTTISISGTCTNIEFKQDISALGAKEKLFSFLNKAKLGKLSSDDFDLIYLHILFAWMVLKSNESSEVKIWQSCKNLSKDELVKNYIGLVQLLDPNNRT